MTAPAPTRPEILAGLIVMTAVCCRSWPVAVHSPVGRCDLCGVRPVVVR